MRGCALLWATVSSVTLPKPVSVGHAQIHPVSFLQAVEYICQRAGTTDNQAHYVVTANLDHLRLLHRNQAMRQAYDSAAMRTADGAPILWLARLAGQHIPERVTGADLVPAICARAAQLHLCIMFVGGAPGVATQATDVVARMCPGLATADALAPSPGFEEDAEISEALVADITRAGADIVFFCVGTPKSEIWLFKNQSRLPPAMFIPAGAAVDFVAGARRRAPEHVRRFQLEWFFRFLIEPKRMLKRYVLDAAHLVFMVGPAMRSRRRSGAAGT
ncbi:MAG: capsular biosynthesis protein [Rhizobacter sp.]|nr:capsular biosynthesis protein [Rhizobacter sp.]